MSMRRSRENQSHMIGELFTFALFAMFLLLSLLIVVIGVDGYRSVIDQGEVVGGIRTSLGYVAGKVRSEASMDGIRLEHTDGTDILALTEIIDDVPYDTIIFHRDGALYETYINAEEGEFNPEFGERLADIDAFTMAWAEDGLLALTATTGEESQTLHLAARTTAQEVKP